MNRIIKFRAWNKIREEMVPVAQVQFGDDGSALTLLVETAPLQHGTWPLVDGESCYLMQFTGLKDKNGVEIYEGDIIQWRESNGALQVEKVDWDEELCAFVSRDEIDFVNKFLGGTQRNHLEVIGNIYENPELLKP